MSKPHISVCICTFKRREMLKRLLEALSDQRTDESFTYSLIVVDNDTLHSAENVVTEFASRSAVHVQYSVEPKQSIALARNRALELATGEYVAFVDDDEFPAKNWLLQLLKTCEKFRVGGVLGPVKRHFETEPPEWISRGTFFIRPSHDTGFQLDWQDTRTGNALVRRRVVQDLWPTFREQFRSGSDVDFFRRAMARGWQFVWCDEAIVFETIPPSRWTRKYMLRKALLRGRSAALRHAGAVDTLKSIVAVPTYLVALPLARLFGEHRFVLLMVKLCDHLGKLLTLAGFNVIKDAYVTD